jgi:hypothetical protein
MLMDLSQIVTAHRGQARDFNYPLPRRAAQAGGVGDGRRDWRVGRDRPCLPVPHRPDQQRADRKQPHGEGGDVGPVGPGFFIVLNGR